MYALTLQAYTDGIWQDAMTLIFESPEKGFEGRCRFAYKQSYLLDHIEDMGSPFACAVSANLPLDWDSMDDRQAPAFLQDIAPAGAARRFLIARVGREKPDDVNADLFLLGKSTPAPVGHLRVKESMDVQDGREPMGFTRADVVARDNRFLEYAYEQGAAIGGATGAGGEAPKLLMSEDHNGLLYPDAVLDDRDVAQHWFVKFARNKSTQTDQDILRSEYHYYRALQVLGIETVSVQGLKLEEANRPSLWMQRFDRHVTEQGTERSAVESVYSLAGVTVPGSRLKHLEVITRLVALWRQAGQGEQVEDLVADYLRRDLLNKILGNSDNHGRNTSIIRDQRGVRLAPIYDLAPMVMDDEGVTRSTKWARDIERGGEVDWRKACDALAGLVEPQAAFERLRADARHLLALPDILTDSGLPAVTMNHPLIALKRLGQRLRDWGLA
ncbi:type II toxin-antitoxin system HipA family toxin [Pseudomonas sp. RHF3.3-3]|uniref:type II toxin-antitoxin system HipA family toxin n=1 Tax=Pseudomonas sp. RHF3.3-3 TaxID=3396624 RepID=UPI003A861B6B